MEYKFENIIFNFTEGEEDFIGMYELEEIPSKHVIAMKKDNYYIEQQFNYKSYRILPHVDIYDYEENGNIVDINRSITNPSTDLIIVYFDWITSYRKRPFLNNNNFFQKYLLKTS